MERKKAEPLFGDWQETLIWSCIQGVMGKIYVDSLENPLCAGAVLGDFCFLAGLPNKELVLFEPNAGSMNFMIMVPQNNGWADLIEKCYREKARKVMRYAIKKETDCFDTKKLQAMVDALPKEYTLAMIDEKWFWRCKEVNWCRDFVSQYGDYAMYKKYGLGVVILKDGVLISGASSYSGYKGGIEIEIDTREDYQRRGLAGVCGAKLILECIKRGWYPSWDAQNKWSLSLAQKLGYHFDHEYTAYEVTQ